MRHWSGRAVMVTFMSFWLVGMAQASPVTFSPDIFNPSDVKFLKNGGDCTGTNTLDVLFGVDNGGCDSLSYTHSLLDFNPSTDILTSGSLSLRFYDDWNDGNPETFDVVLGSFDFANNETITSGSTQSQPFGISFDVLAYVTSDGQLSVNLSRGNQSTNNDFFFAGSTLNANGLRSDPAPLPTPEPASLLLVGTGLIAVVRRFWSRRQ